MKIIKNWLLVSTAIMLLLPGSLPTVAAESQDKEKSASESDGYTSAKDEVIYATLNTNGEEQKIYAVNKLDVTKAGEVIDYGDYSNIKNLTDLSELEQDGDKVQVDAPKGKFYYQGDLDNASLPWNFSITYSLDGKEMPAKDLAGKDGHLEIKINTSANNDVDPAFFENYLLQISSTFDSGKTDNIVAKDGTVANAGKDEQVTFTVMPDNEEKLVIEADVEDFESDGIDITGIPSAVSIDPPDTDDFTGDIKTLASAIADVNDGVADLQYGVSELNSGALELKDGSTQYKNGILRLDGSSAELVSGSNDIKGALETLNTSLGDMEDVDVSGLEQLTGGIAQISGGLREAAKGLSTLKENYANAYQAMDQAMIAIPSHEITEEDIQALYASGANKETIDKLVETYTSARTAKGTYQEVKQGFDAVDSTLGPVANSLNEAADNLDKVVNELSGALGNTDMADGLDQLKKGIESLSTNYKSFHAGLLEYTGGVSELSSNYSEINDGIGELYTGTNELENGVVELHKGTTELEKSTSDLPEEMTKEIDEMIEEFDKSDFDAVSFVSPEKNEHVFSVQFVLKTEPIEKDEQVEEEKPEAEKKGIWKKFKDLFL